MMLANSKLLSLFKEGFFIDISRKFLAGLAVLVYSRRILEMGSLVFIVADEVRLI